MNVRYCLQPSLMGENVRIGDKCFVEVSILGIPKGDCCYDKMGHGKRTD